MSPSPAPAPEDLDVAECWRRLAVRGVGRVCFCVGERVQVALVPYVVAEGRLHCRAASFGPVARRASAHPVSVEVDDLVGDRATWSVTVTGAARLVTDPGTTALLWSPVRRSADEPGRAHLWISVEADDVRGRRLRP